MKLSQNYGNLHELMCVVLYGDILASILCYSQADMNEGSCTFFIVNSCIQCQY